MDGRKLVALAAVLCACQSAPQARSSPSGPAAVTSVEEVEVSASGQPAFRTSLDRGELFLLEARGAVTLGDHWQDAEYIGSPGDQFTADVTGQTDVGLDVGVKQVLPARGRKPAPPSDGRLKWFEPFRADHRYHLLVVGEGRPLAVRLVEPEGSPAGQGAITVSLFRLSPAPPPLAEPLETVMVPAREKLSVRSRLIGQPGTTYLLQAAGEVQVGGPRHMGDAEFHDYKPDGRGINEGEEGVDFGVGVDEPVIGLGHDPRARKWGPWRKDHCYYMLYAGTGQPIALNYHDTGGKSGVYKDNEGFLPVKIFAVP